MPIICEANRTCVHPIHFKNIRPRHGFTLVELIMVVVIVAIIAAMAAPRWAAASQRYQLDLAAQRVVADLAMVKSRANFTSAPLTVIFDVGSSAYRVTGMPDPDHANSTYAVKLSAAPYRAVIKSVAFGNAAQVTFDGYGMPTQTGSGGGQRTITLDASGRTTVQ
jgi:prepilin-type N-terminal cleavage/methylation domain-containing protein